MILQSYIICYLVEPLVGSRDDIKMYFKKNPTLLWLCVTDIAVANPTHVSSCSHVEMGCAILHCNISLWSPSVVAVWIDRHNIATYELS